MDPSPNRINLTGKIVGKLIVVKYEYTIKKETFWKCDCQCGRTVVIRGKHLNEDRIKSCGCERRKRSKFRKGVGDIPLHYFNDIKKKAAMRGFEFTVTIEEVWNLFLEQKEKCALSGVDLYFPKVQSRQLRGTQTASLDRKDSDLGYVISNVQWVHKHINIMKQDLKDDEFIAWCTTVADFNV